MNGRADSRVSRSTGVEHAGGRLILLMKQQRCVFLALGGDESTPIHERGIQLTAAFVLGNLELEDIDVNYPLVLNNGTVNLMVVMRRLSGKRK
jgi:hypothetical protein